jgi:hypothetical protein
MKLSRILALCVAGVLSSLPAAPATIGPEETPAHAGETATVCGVVESAHFASKSRAQPTFLDFGRPYPNQLFVALIWGSGRPKFREPEKTLQGKRICVTGTVRLYHKIPEVILTDPSQITE